MTVAVALQDYCEEIYYCRVSPAAYFPSIIYSCTIPVLNIIYQSVAKRLTDWENHKTHSQHQDALIIKLTCFHFINNYLALFYIFFWLGDLVRLTEYLYTLMITSQLFSTVAEIGLPYLSAKYAHYQANVKRSSLNVKAKKTDGTVTKDGIDKNLVLLAKRERSHHTDIFDIIYAADIRLHTYNGLLNEYFSVLRDHGFVIMFGWCWGLAPLCALLSNRIQLRFDMWKICTSYRRLLHRDANGIGAWDTVLKVYAILFIAIIFAMLATYEIVISEDGPEGAEPFCWSLGIWAEKLARYFEEWPAMRKMFERLALLKKATNEFKLLVIIILEHLVFALFFVLSYAIPSIPGHVRQSIQRRKYVEHELAMQQLQLSSSQKHRSKSFYHAKRRSMHIDRVARYSDPELERKA
eukprot:CAMPEP_0184489476 /NCGR_PEP_ID=MMETSP0113_2-20130426/15532_1 /TAXON_ID=91329 /ORGANISM="Norrisiella sphaerica, Strain BC52" /LENGTH=408 /DNA_ID=CAMNT_0026872913 /DNA_START=1096 /DNA_END=2322 /DNA_ORIENTATION=+